MGLPSHGPEADPPAMPPHTWGMNPTSRSRSPNKHTTNHDTATPRQTNQAQAAAPVPALEEMLDDIDRLIFHVVSPFVDDSNPMLHLDELCAECRFKLARIISDGRMQDCPTRGKFFGFLKVAFQNHIRSQVQKHAFTQKRAGIAIQASDDSVQVGHSARTKLLHLSLNDEDLGLQVGSNEDERRSWGELIDHLEGNLSSHERAVIQHMKTAELPYPQARRFLQAHVAGCVPKHPGWKLKHYVAELGLSLEEFTTVMWGIRAKCRAMLAES